MQGFVGAALKRPRCAAESKWHDKIFKLAIPGAWITSNLVKRTAPKSFARVSPMSGIGYRFFTEDAFRAQ